MSNEKRLIDANELKAKAFPTDCIGEDPAVWVSDIDEAPTVDAVEVVHARWEYDSKSGDGICTNCGFHWWASCQECGVSPLDTFYCPNCGAKMDGGDKDG